MEGDYINDMVDRVDLLSEENRYDSDANDWTLGETSQENYIYGNTEVSFNSNTSGEVISTSVTKVSIFKNAFRSNYRLAIAVGHQLRVISTANNGYIINWANNKFSGMRFRGVNAVLHAKQWSSSLIGAWGAYKLENLMIDYYKNKMYYGQLD